MGIGGFMAAGTLVFWLALTVYTLILATRFVKAVETIAEKYRA